MSYIKISPKGKAFLKRGAAAIVAKAIVSKKNELLSDDGLVVKIGNTSVTVKLASPQIKEALEA